MTYLSHVLAMVAANPIGLLLAAAQTLVVLSVAWLWLALVCAIFGWPGFAWGSLALVQRLARKFTPARRPGLVRRTARGVGVVLLVILVLEVLL